MRANYKVEISSGIFLLLGVAALVWLATTATDYGRDIGKETYPITARFQILATARPGPGQDRRRYDRPG